jgi:WD40 repeat protein
LELPKSPGYAQSGIFFTPDGRWLVITSSDNEATRWPLVNDEVRPEPERLFRQEEGKKFISPVTRLSDDRRWFVNNSGDDLQLWPLTADRGECQPLSLKADTAKVPVQAVYFSADGKWLITAAGDVIGLWHLTPAKPQSWRPAHIVPGYSGGIGTVAISDQGDRLAVAGFDSVIRLWSLDAPVLLDNPLKLGGQRNQPTTLTIDTKGERVITVTLDSVFPMARFWTLSDKQLELIAGRAAGRNLSDAEWSQFQPWLKTKYEEIFPEYPKPRATAVPLAR